MAKLDKKHAKQVNDAEQNEFPVLPDGAYHVRLNDVDDDRNGPAGPYWSWIFEVVEPGDFEFTDSKGKTRTVKFAGQKLWNNTSLSEAAAFSMQNTFQAFGVEPDTDTDDLCGQVIKAIVNTRTIQSGARKGQPANQIVRLAPKDDDFEIDEDLVGAASGGQPKEDDIF